MAAIADLSALVNRMTGGNSGTPENLFFHKIPTFNAGTILSLDGNGRTYSSWRVDGIPGAGATPTTVVAPTSATAGAFPITNPGGGREKFLIQATVLTDKADEVVSFLLYDRLLQIGGLSGTVTSAQTVGGTLTRNTGGVGNMIWAEINTDIGTTVTSMTASYTNQAGTSGRTATITRFGSTGQREACIAIPFALQGTDTGVQAVASVTLAGTTGTAGDFGVVVARPLTTFVANALGSGHDFVVGPGGMPKIDTDACLAFFYDNVSNQRVHFSGMLATVEA